MDVDPPRSVTTEVFARWRTVRRGTGQAQRMNNPLWEWLVETGHGPYPVNQHFEGPPSTEAGPGWTNERFGQSRTSLPDGRIVLIAGEHEDYYDPDFFIYNDVIVRHPSGDIDIYGYGPEVFPPTDFHTATLIDDEIVLIGNLGYQEQRRPGATQVLILDTATWHVRSQPTDGDAPGWIHRHTAEIRRDGIITLSGGSIYEATTPPVPLENIDEWELDTTSWRWMRRTRRSWQRWQFSRSDGGPTELWRLRTQQLAAGRRRLDPGPLTDLYEPPLDHQSLPTGRPEEFNVFRLDVGDVTVRYVEDMTGVMMTVEGQLPEDTIQRLVDDLSRKLSLLEGLPYIAVRRS